jgi:hypothetical protein
MRLLYAVASLLMMAAVVSASCPMFKQCGQSWSSDQLGFGSSTICGAGCAMSSVAMALACKGVSTNPGHLNTWLKGHGGYQGSLIVWSAVDGLGKLKFQARAKYSCTEMGQMIRAGKMLILNVRGGGHWVLATGADGSTLHVNDPGYNVGSYSCSEVVMAAVYA